MPLDRFRAAVEAYCRVVDKHSDAALMGYRESKSLSRQRLELIKRKEIETNRFISNCIEECVETAVFRPVDVEMLTYLVVIFVHGWALNAWRLSPPRSVDAYVDDGLRLLLRDVLAEEKAEEPQERQRNRLVQPRPPARRSAAASRNAAPYGK